MKHRLFGMFLLFACCQEKELRVLDLGSFSLVVPGNWEHKQQQGFDSFVGVIEGPNVSLFFDCSKMGYASSLTETPERYVQTEILHRQDLFFLDPDITYTSARDVEIVRRQLMEETHTTDTSLVRVHPFPEKTRKVYKATEKDKVRFKDADYLVDLTFHDSTITFPIVLPDEIKRQHIQIDTVGDYIIKKVWPRESGNGMTGIYIESLTSSFNLQINGMNLSPADEQLAIRAFQSIRIDEQLVRSNVVLPVAGIP